MPPGPHMPLDADTGSSPPPDADCPPAHSAVHSPLHRQLGGIPPEEVPPLDVAATQHFVALLGYKIQFDQQGAGWRPALANGMQQANSIQWQVEDASKAGALSQRGPPWDSVQALAQKACVRVGIEALQLGDSLREVSATVDAVGSTSFGPDECFFI